MILPPILKQPQTLWYMATPYTKYHEGIEAAFQEASYYAAKLLQQGVNVYSPIAHSHPISIHGGIDPLDHELWLTFDELLMRRCDGMVIITMVGWGASRGIKAEIDIFNGMQKPVILLAPPP